MVLCCCQRHWLLSNPASLWHRVRVPPLPPLSQLTDHGCCCYCVCVPLCSYCAAVFIVLVFVSLTHSVHVVANVAQVAATMSPIRTRACQTTDDLMEGTVPPYSVVPSPVTRGGGAVVSPATTAISSAAPSPATRRTSRPVLVQPRPQHSTVAVKDVDYQARPPVAAGHARGPSQHSMRSPPPTLPQEHIVLRDWLALQPTSFRASDRRSAGASILFSPTHRSPQPHVLPPITQHQHAVANNDSPLSDQQLLDAADAGIDTELAVDLPVREYVRSANSFRVQQQQLSQTHYASSQHRHSVSHRDAFM